MEEGPKTKLDLSTIKYTPATMADADEMYKLVLDAYIVEVGTEGIAFKTKNRYLSIDQLHEDIRKATEPAPGTE